MTQESRLSACATVTINNVAFVNSPAENVIYANGTQKTVFKSGISIFHNRIPPNKSLTRKSEELNIVFEIR